MCRYRDKKGCEFHFMTLIGVQLSYLKDKRWKLYPLLSSQSSHHALMCTFFFLGFSFDGNSFLFFLSYPCCHWFRTKWICESTTNTCWIHKALSKSRHVISKHCFTDTGNALMLDSKSIKRCLRDDLIMQIKLSTVGGVNVNWLHLTNPVDLLK